MKRRTLWPVLFLLAPSIARADVPWTWGIAAGTTQWWVILLGILVEWPAVRYLTRRTWIRSLWPCVAMNLVSTLIGASILFWPVLAMPFEILLRAFLVPGAVVVYALVVAMNALIEGVVLRQAFSSRITMTGFVVLYLVNALTVGLMFTGESYKQIVQMIVGKSYDVVPTPRAARSVAIADLNRDGIVDLVVTDADAGSDSIAILRGVGNGRFQGRMIAEPGFVPSSLCVADLDGDSYSDIVMSSYQGIHVFRGDAAGAFSNRRMIPWPDAPFMLATAHLNGDSLPDLVAWANPTMMFFLGDRDSMLVLRSTHYLQAHRGNSVLSGSAIATGDLNRDGYDDVAVVQGDSCVVVILTDGNGSPGEARRLSAPLCGGIMLQHLDPDEDLDLIVDHYPFPGLSIFPGRGSGNFGRAKKLPWVTPGDKVTSGDFNNDGTIDLAVLASGRIRTLYGTGTDSLIRGREVWTEPDPYDLIAGDINGDGRPDLVTAHGARRSLAIHINGRRGKL